MNISKKITAAIIAGGESRRFGASKALASFGSKTLLERSIDLAKLLTPDVIVVTGREGQVPNPGIRMVSDLIPGCGPLGGIHSALSHAEHNWIITLPCDMPLLTTDVYRHLLEGVRFSRPVVAMSHKGLEPLVGVWPKSALRNIGNNLHKKRYSIREILKELETLYLDMQLLLHPYRGWIFSNINYREDLRTVEMIRKVTL